MVKRILLLLLPMIPLSGETYYLIDDFTREKSFIDGEWEGFTDQVMGGISEISVSRLVSEGDAFIRMSGPVSLENNGGFIQIRHDLSRPFSVFDASSYTGVRLKIRGRGEGYYIFLRTSATLLPWKFYKGKISLEEDWTIVDLPWESFEEGDYGRIGTFRPDKLKSLALVAYGRQFQAQVDLAEIGFYR